MYAAFQKMWPNNLTANARSGENNLYQHYARELPIDTNFVCNSNITTNSQSGLGIGIVIPDKTQPSEPIQIKQKRKSDRKPKRKNKSKKKTHKSHKQINRQAKKKVYKAKKKQTNNKNKHSVKSHPMRKQERKNKIKPNF